VARHGAGITDTRKGSGDDNPVKTGEYASDLVLVGAEDKDRLSEIFWFRLCRVRE